MRTFKPEIPRRKRMTASEEARYREKLIRRLNLQAGYSTDYLKGQTMAKLVQLKNRLPAYRGLSAQGPLQIHRHYVKLT